MTDDDISTRPNHATGRRSVLGVIGGTVAGIGVSSVAAGRADDGPRSEGESNTDAAADGRSGDERSGPDERDGTATASVVEALEVQETLLESGRYCAVHGATLDAIGREVGDQLRVRRTDADEEYAVYTVSERLEEDDEGTVRMGRDGRERLGTEDTFDATVDATVPRPDLSEQGAEANDEFIEHLSYGGDRVIVLSPHGGMISPETDDQADTVARRLSSVTRWGCKGWFAERGAFERWFVSPRDLSPVSFPDLARIVDRRFEYSVSFRGLESEGVEVVGDEDGDFTRDIADAIEGAVDDLEVTTRDLTDEDGPYGDDQLTARLTAEGGNSVWLGQSRDAREDHGEEIAAAVADVLERDRR